MYYMYWSDATQYYHKAVADSVEGKRVKLWGWEQFPSLKCAKMISNTYQQEPAQRILSHMKVS